MDIPSQSIDIHLPPNAPNEGDNTPSSVSTTPATPSPARNIRFGIGAAETTFVSSGIDGSVYGRWLLEMADVDPTHLDDIVEGLVRRLFARIYAHSDVDTCRL